MFMRGPRFNFQLSVLLGALLLSALEILLEVHVPGTDVFLFKEAGVNLATKGKFVASYLPHMAFGDERPFAYYPPLYPFFFGVWSWVVGIGLKQSLLFDSLLRLIRTFLMLRLFVPALPDSFFEKKKSGIRWGTGLLFCVLSLLSTDRDRPDELALIWGLMLCLILNSQQHQRTKVVVGSILLACVGATSPACGVLFGLIGAVWSFSQKRAIQVFISLGISSLFCWALMVMPVVLLDSGSSLRFSKQAGISSFPYLRHLRESMTVMELWRAWLSDLKLFWTAGIGYLVMAMGGVFIGGFLLVRNRLRLESRPRNLLVAPLIYCLMVPLVWTLQPYYVWFSSIVLISGIFYLVQQETQKVQGAVIAAYFLFLVPLLFWESKCILNALEVPKSERGDVIRDEVLAKVGPKDKMAVTHDQYFTFRSVKEVVNIDYWGHEANQFDYLYITDLPDSRRRVPRSRQILSEKDRPCFVLVKDFSTYTPIHVLGHSTPHFVRGNGGSLFRNICKESEQAS